MALDRHEADERKRLVEALERAGGNRRRAAEILGIGRATLYRWIERHGIGHDVAKVIADRYEILSVLGKGSNATVFRVRDRSHPGTEYALKLAERAVGDATREEQLRAEYRTLSLLRHPHLVRVHDFGMDRNSGRSFLVMDLIEGTFFARACEGKPMAWIAGALKSVLSAVERLHRHGLVHRDLKSENVLVRPACEVTEPAHVTVMDLGFTTEFSSSDSDSGGTLLYAAPELLRGATASVRSDLYALGVMFYLGLTGRYPYAGATSTQTIDEHRAGGCPPPSHWNDEVPPWLDGICKRLLESDPKRRYSNAGAVIDELERWGTVASEISSRTIEWSLVGRDALLQELLADLCDEDDRLRKDRPPALLLSGESGSGKSRLLDALASALRTRGVRIIQGAQLFDDEEVGVDRFHLIDRVAEKIVTAARRQPHAVLVDDLDEADPLLVDLVWHLARRSHRFALKVLLTSSSPEASESLTRFVTGAQAERLLMVRPVRALDADATRALAEEALGVARAAILSESLFELTGGHPLFLTETLRGLLRTGAGIDDLALLPTSIQHLFDARFRALTSAARELVEALAVAGGVALRTDLQALIGDRFAPALSENLEEGLVEETPTSRIALVHKPLAGWVMGSIDDPLRRGWRRRWIETLRGIDASPERLAPFLADALEGRDEVDLLLRAADDANESGQFHVAARYFRIALEHLDPGDTERLELYPKLHRAHHAGQDRQRIESVCLEWAELARELGAPVAQARALGQLAAAYREMARWDDAQRAAERAVAMAEQSKSPEAEASAERILGSVLWASWRHHRALAHLERAVAKQRELGDSRMLAICLHDVSLPRVLMGRLAQGLEATAEAARLAEESGDVYWAHAVHNNEALIYGYIGENERAIETLQLAIDGMRAVELDGPLVLPLESLAIMLERTGRHSQAMQVASELVELATRRHLHAYRIAGLMHLGRAAIGLDDHGAARDHHRMAYELAVAFEEKPQQLFALLALAGDLRREGRLEAARERALESFQAARERGNLRILGQAALELARIERSDAALAAAERYLDEAEQALGVNREEVYADRADLALERARVARAGNNAERVQACISSGLGHARRSGAIETEIRLLELRAQHCDQAGETEAATQALWEAEAAIRELAQRQPGESERERVLARPDLAALLLASARRGSSKNVGDAISTDALANLYEVSRTIAEQGEVEPLMEKIVAIAVGRTGAERGLLMLRDAKSGELRSGWSRGIDEQSARDAANVSKSVLEQAGRGVSVLISDAESDPTFSQSASVTLFGIRSIMCVPLRIGEEVLGTLYVDSRAQRGYFSEDDLRFLQALSDQLALALAYGQLVGRVSRERAEVLTSARQAQSFGRLIGRSTVMLDVFAQLEKIASSELSLLILGESGTGKELVARAVHAKSPRCDGPFLSENCAALPESLLESILFGHRRGSFTGAEEDKKGLFELAKGGTLFLDEVGDMSPALQAKLLRVLQEREVRPLGAAASIEVDVRVIAATHQDLADLVATGRFRQDLFYRLNGVTVVMPPLRERREDIPPLFEHLLKKECVAQGRESPKIDPAVMRALVGYDWPGNVRELENTARRMLLFEEDGRIGPAALASAPELVASSHPQRRETSRERTERGAGDADEHARILEAIRASGGNKSDAAVLLGISRATLYRRLKELEAGDAIS